MDSADVMAQITALKAKAEKLEDEQAKARDAVVSAEAKLNMLREQLLERFMCSDWEEADSLLAKMQLEAEYSLQAVIEAFQESGVSVD